MREVEVEREGEGGGGAEREYEFHLSKDWTSVRVETKSGGLTKND